MRTFFADTRGITKIETLLLLLAIGVFGTLAAVSVMSARAATRDVTRLAHIRDVQSGLELYFNDHSAYPTTENTADVPLGQVLSACLTLSGFTASCGENDATPYVKIVPTPPTSGLKGKVSCGGVTNAYCFASDGASYHVRFELERANTALGLAKGINCATESGWKAGECPALAQ